MASASIRPPKPESMPARFNYPSLLGNPDSTQPKSALNVERDIAAIGGHYFHSWAPLVYGHGVRGNVAKLLRLAQMPVPLPFGGITNLRSLLSVQNLVDAIFFCSSAKRLSTAFT
jgi:hypothetical protein